MFDALKTQASALLKKHYSLQDTDVLWQCPKDVTHGDASTSVALQLAKTLGKKPREIAETLAAGLSKVEGVKKAEVAGAGYVNVRLTPEALIKELDAARESHKPKSKRKGERPVIVEYSQPNIAKPLGIHHILSTIIGQSVANLYRHEGYPTISINHLGDWGTQFGKLFVATQKWGKKTSAKTLGLDGLLDLYVKFHEESEKDASLEDQAREAFKRMEDGDVEMRAFWKDVVDVTMKALDRVYERLHVSFDQVQGESFYEDKMAPILEEGKDKGVFVEGKEGALIVEFPEESNLPPSIVLKGDGATLYSTRDLATIRYRVDQWHPEEILYVVDVAQQLYFQQLFETVRKLGWDLPVLEHVLFGRMRFADRKMSTRKGNILKLEDVIDEAVKEAEKVIKEHEATIQTDDSAALAEMMGVGALVYGILSQNRKMDIVFDWKKMLSFEGNSAPYLQYTHARARSVLRKADDERLALRHGSGQASDERLADIDSLSDSERTLIHSLMQFPVAIEEARVERMPHKLANLLYQICQNFNAFYNVEPILKAEGPVRSLRLLLTRDAADALRVGAELLTLRVPDRM